MPEEDFYNSGVFRGAIERIRGQYVAKMYEKRRFYKAILNHMQDNGFIRDFCSAEQKNRYDITVTMPSGKICAIELKGCLDGNNANIFERPAHAQEFLVWSMCSNKGASPPRNCWSGIHTRLGADIIVNSKVVDGLIVWDWICGTIGRQCPKIQNQIERATKVQNFIVPPPCIYIFPNTIPNFRSNPKAKAQKLENVEFLDALNKCFAGRPAELNFVSFDVKSENQTIFRRTTVVRNDDERQSDFTEIKRG